MAANVLTSLLAALSTLSTRIGARLFRPLLTLQDHHDNFIESVLTAIQHGIELIMDITLTVGAAFHWQNRPVPCRRIYEVLRCSHTGHGALVRNLHPLRARTAFTVVT